MRHQQPTWVLLLGSILVHLALPAECRKSSSKRADNGAASSANYASIYEALNDYLQEKIANEEVGSNIAAASELLNQELSGGGNRNAESNHFIDGLKRFVSLGELVAPNKHAVDLERSKKLCGKVGHQILVDNNRATNNRVQRPLSKMGALHRVELVLLRVAQQHALECMPVYPIKFQELWTNLKPVQLDNIKLIDSFLKPILIARLNEQLRRPRLVGSVNVRSASSRKKFYLRVITQLESMRELKVVQILSQHLSNNSNKSGQKNTRTADEPDSGVSDDERPLLIKGRAQKHIFEPCLDYVQQFGAEVFAPATYDLLALGKQQRYESISSTTSWPRDGSLAAADQTSGAISRAYTRAWVRFGFCNSLLRDQGTLLNKMVSVSLSRPA